MNPFSLAITAIRLITTIRPAAPVDEPAPAPVEKRAKKSAPAVVAPKRKNFTPLYIALATGVCVAGGLYSGQIDGTSALSMLASIDVNGIIQLFQ